MKYTVACYFDVELRKFNPPMLVPMNREDTIESVIDSTKKGQIPGADAFELNILGTYDTATGKFELSEQPEFVERLGDYVRK